jgi:hypothetical protein
MINSNVDVGDVMEELAVALLDTPAHLVEAHLLTQHVDMTLQHAVHYHDLIV